MLPTALPSAGRFNKANALRIAMSLAISYIETIASRTVGTTTDTANELDAFLDAAKAAIAPYKQV